MRQHSYRILLALIVFCSFSGCKNDAPVTMEPLVTHTAMPQSNTPSLKPEISPVQTAHPSSPTPQNESGSLTLGIYGGKYWGFTGLDPNDSTLDASTRLDGYIEDRLMQLCRDTGYNIYIDLYKDAESQESSGTTAGEYVSADDFVGNLIEYFSNQGISNDLYIVYFGMRNEVGIYTDDPNLAGMEIGYIKAAFCNPNISDPIERVKNAIDVLKSELENILNR